MGMVAPVYFTADMVRTLPNDGSRYETVHGELLVTPAPTLWHQEVVDRVRAAVRSYLATQSVGHLFSAPADISWSDDTLVQPDLFVADLAEARTLDWANVKTLLLVVEILSPSTARYDRFTKRRLYQEVNVPAYWIVDPEACTVEVWIPEAELPQVERDRVEWSPKGATESFELELAELFKPI